MLPLVSSMTTTEIGWMSFSKKTIGCGFSLSKHLEVVLHEVRHEALLRVGDRGEQRDDLRAGLEGRLLRGDRRQAQAEGERERHPEPRVSHGFSLPQRGVVTGGRHWRGARPR